MNPLGGDPKGEDEGLLSGLPKTRPVVPTRRRDEARAAAAGRDEASQRPSSGTGAPPTGEEPSGGPPDDGQARDPSLGGAVEDLARVSAEAAASTAVAGLRLAGRAAGGLGRALTRR